MRTSRVFQAHGLGFPLNDEMEDFVVGSPGGPAIVNRGLQVILNALDFGMNMQKAVDQPRIPHRWMPDSMMIEVLKRRGHNVRMVPQNGEVTGIGIDGQWIEGAAGGWVEAAAKGY